MINYRANKSILYLRNYFSNTKFQTVLFILIGASFFFNIDSGDFDIRFFLGELAGFINLVAYYPYIISILKNETKPNFVTWWIWSFLELSIILSYFKSGADSTLWLPIASFLGMFSVAVLSIWYGRHRWSFIDSLCLIGSLIGLNVWILLGNPLLALVLFLFIDFLAIIPTILKSKKYPLEEDIFAWGVTLLSGFVNLFAINNNDFFVIVLPIYYFVLYLFVFLSLFFFRNNSKKGLLIF